MPLKNFKLKRLRTLHGKLHEKKIYYKEKYQIIFTHEWVMDNQVEQYLEWFCMYAKEKGIPFSFPQENMEN